MLGHRWGDTRADDLFRNNYPDDISAGTRKVPAKSDDWSNPYKMVFWANRIIEHAPEHGTTASQIDRFVAEAYFFRAYAYYQLVCKFGGVPILVNTVGDIDDPILYGPRASREEVMTRIYTDLNLAARELPAAFGTGRRRVRTHFADGGSGFQGARARSMKARVGNSMAKSRPSPISRLPMKLPTR
ncbi:MAG: RagB/SusD family nutrient uptake outer membrane protein [Alistipes finegoldii]